MAAAGAAEEDRQLVADEFAAAAREDGRAVGEACPLLLVAAGRESSDAAPVWKHGAADGGSAGTIRIACDGGEANRAKGGGDGEVSEKSPEMRHFRVLAYPEEPELAPSRSAEVARDEKYEKSGADGNGWMYNQCRPGWQNPDQVSAIRS